jgi:hypothetical protein
VLQDIAGRSAWSGAPQTAFADDLIRGPHHACDVPDAVEYELDLIDECLPAELAGGHPLGIALGVAAGSVELDGPAAIDTNGPDWTAGR